MEKQLPGLAPQHLHLGEEGEGALPRPDPLALSLCKDFRPLERTPEAM